MRTVPAMLAALFVVAASATAVARPTLAERGEAELARTIEGRVAGTPVDCIYLHDITSTEIIDGTAIVYRTLGNRLYVNRPSMGERSLSRGKIMVTDTHSSKLCSVDTVKLLDGFSRFPSGFVGLSEFVPYTKVSAAR